MCTVCRSDCFVCCNYTLATAPVAKRRDQPLQFPNRRGRESAARAGIFRSLSTGQATNRLYIYKNNKRIFKRSTEQVFKGNHAL
ncbi:hypothetical protein E0X97_20725 [Salmonella enterica subsp. enterica serovar Alachua]|nr:hypothetical protein [Salmonella enterica subsp. enterica serovar Alachua]